VISEHKINAGQHALFRREMFADATKGQHTETLYSVSLSRSHENVGGKGCRPDTGIMCVCPPQDVLFVLDIHIAINIEIETVTGRIRVSISFFDQQIGIQSVSVIPVVDVRKNP
jgi:hypothetical protein